MARSALVLSALLAACSSFPAERTELAPGSVLVLPPRDVIQDGSPHPDGAGTGQTLLELLVTEFRGTAFEPLQTDAPAFDHLAIADQAAALAEAQRLGADYCLQLVLGEFRNAAPMTFRSDFVTLAQGVMWSTASGGRVWWQTQPYTVQKTNIGSIGGLFADIASAVVGSISK